MSAEEKSQPTLRIEKAREGTHVWLSCHLFVKHLLSIYLGARCWGHKDERLIPCP